jgi:hypothetical protein
MELRDMSKMRAIGRMVMSGILAAGISVLLAGSVLAHCDTTSGPIIPEARAALNSGDVTPVLKWVKKENEAEIGAAFAKAVAVRAKGPEARELADQYFLETLIRLHRAGEDAPYSAIKDEPVAPIVALADKSLADGSADEMVKRMSDHMAKGVKEKFNKAFEARKLKDKSVEAGREYVEAYVAYTHYIEGIHAAIKSAGGHHHAGAAASSAPAATEHKEHKK